MASCALCSRASARSRREVASSTLGCGVPQNLAATTTGTNNNRMRAAAISDACAAARCAGWWVNGGAAGLVASARVSVAIGVEIGRNQGRTPRRLTAAPAGGRRIREHGPKERLCRVLHLPSLLAVALASVTPSPVAAVLSWGRGVTLPRAASLQLLVSRVVASVAAERRGYGGAVLVGQCGQYGRRRRLIAFVRSQHPQREGHARREAWR